MKSINKNPVVEKLESLDVSEGPDLAKAISIAKNYDALNECLNKAKTLSSDRRKEDRASELFKSSGGKVDSGMNLPSSGRAQDATRIRMDSAYATAYAEQKEFKKSIRVIEALIEEISSNPDWEWIEQRLRGTGATVVEEEENAGELKKFAFISRHTPTSEQMELAREQGINMVHIGDADAFTVSPSFVQEHGAFAGVVVVHPAAALRLAETYMVGVFENANRAPAGEKPEFFAKELHIYNLKPKPVRFIIGDPKDAENQIISRLNSWPEWDPDDTKED